MQPASHVAVQPCSRPSHAADGHRGGTCRPGRDRLWVINTARQAGGVLGVALIGSLVHARATFIPRLRAGLVIAAGAIITGFGIKRND
jgi:hypothetical protein